MTQRWALHHEPHRHYKYLGDNGKWSWQIGKARIAGVTTILDGGQDSLAQWAANTAIGAGQQVAVDWLGAGPALAGSLLSFGELANLSGRMPNDVRDRKGRSGTLLHGYLATRLGVPTDYDGLSYGLRVAVDRFVHDWCVCPVNDELGPRVERCVGDAGRAVGGTYDAQVFVVGSLGGRGMETGVHRIDAKQSNTVQPKHLAQLAAYERCAVLCGEAPSDYLTLIHCNDLGDYEPHSIRVGSDEHALALAVFDAHLVNYRGLPALGKLLKLPQED